MEVTLDNRTRISDDESSFGSDVDTDLEVGLEGRKPQHQYSVGIVPALTKADNGDGEPLENTSYLDQYGGAIEDLNIRKLINSTNKGGKEIIKAKSKQMEEEIMEEEVIEVEFEEAIPKLHTHTVHCPHCDRQITKVKVRRIIIKPKLPNTEQPKQPAPVTVVRDLFGCSSCLSLCLPQGEGRFNPLPFWLRSADAPSGGNDVVTEDGNCFSFIPIFPKQPEPGNVDQHSKSGSNKLPIPKGVTNDPNAKEEPSKPKNQLPTSGVPPSHPPYIWAPGEGEPRIDIPPAIPPPILVPTPRLAGQDSTSFEILKSIVYGGLMEVIASLSIVASAAAGDATTLNIVALALANLIGGIFVIGHNLWDLKDDCYKYSTQETSNQEARSKYKELLGSVDHFPMHVFFTILSFLVFGIIPPVAYGYSFHETNDKDFTMVIVAVTSFVCVGLLAIFKAYIDRCAEFSGYVKTITYYLTTSVTVSGVSYAAGNLATKLMEELGLFETGSNVAIAVLPEVVSANPSLAYY
ncbi:hypothetical protein L1987_03969 [Smallanthus sonchifolius]|uniref:Uncharacterized protein n=1 Tax=Smallanthus sonchifolius TaxID=185202 RepID=A0ACB9KC68_9ASTR|nr:hypothetical protein L1987_03969 [Smallanthus sonchifolius]